MTGTNMRRARLALVLCTLAVMACRQDKNATSVLPTGEIHPSVTFELKEVRTMGWPGLADSTRALNDQDRKLSGAVLGAPLSAVMDSAGNTYVLDGMFQKIVIFGPDGAFKSTIAGGFGKGPREFSQPRAMAMSGDTLFVLDINNARVTMFGVDGRLFGSFTMPTPVPMGIATDGQRVYVLTMRLGADYAAVHTYDLRGNRVDSLLTVTGQAANLIAFGGAPVFGYRPGGAVLFAMPTPTVWGAVNDEVLHGRNFYPTAKGYLRKMPNGLKVRALPARVGGIAGLADGSTVVYYYERVGGETQGEVTDKPFMDVYDRAGEYVGSAALDITSSYASISPTADGTEIMLTSFNSDYPKVIVAKLLPLNRARQNDD
ncbi:MAG: hypothetical protein ABIV28_05350 [Longimicrobiales bacterium]